MPYCQTPQAEVYYEDIGEGRPIVLIHGYGVDHQIMKGCMEPVFVQRSGWRRIYLDLPGMGLTRNYDTIADSDSMLEAVLAAVDQLLPGERFSVAGQSYGGYIARGMIQKRPDQIDGVALVCPMIVPAFAERDLPKHQMLRQDDAFVRTHGGKDFDEYCQMGAVLNAYTWQRYMEDILPGCRLSDEAFLERVKTRYGYTFPLETSPFHKPGLLLTGRQDTSTGYRDAWSILEKYPRTTFAALDTAGHNLQIEQPVLFNGLIQEWLDRVELD
jgi:pimeloyl-ACP methyl ester carboxylesterase